MTAREMTTSPSSPNMNYGAMNSSTALPAAAISNTQSGNSLVNAGSPRFASSAGGGFGRAATGGGRVSFGSHFRDQPGEVLDQLAQTNAELRAIEDFSTANSWFARAPVPVHATQQETAAYANTDGGGGGLAPAQSGGLTQATSRFFSFRRSSVGGIGLAHAHSSGLTAPSSPMLNAASNNMQQSQGNMAANNNNSTSNANMMMNATSHRLLAQSIADDTTLRASVRHPIDLKASYSASADTWKHLYITIASRSFYIHTPTLIVQAVILALIYTFLVLTVGGAVTPGGKIFDPVMVVLFGGIVGGGLSVILTLPPLVGILFASIAWANILNRRLVAGVHREVTEPIKVLGLVMILLRGAMSINLKLLKPMKWNALVLASLPLILDVTANTLIVKAVFDFPTEWALLTAATIAPISNSVVVTSVLHVQSLGRGSYGGPLLLLLSCVPIDSACGVFLATFMQSLVMSGASISSAGYQAPAQLIGGLVVGYFMGLVLEIVIDGLYSERFAGATGVDAEHADNALGPAEREKFINSIHLKSLLLVLLTASCGMLVAKHFDLEGAGSLYVVALGCSLANTWSDKGMSERKQALAMRAGVVWNLIAMPALFSFVGASVHLGEVFDGGFLWKGLVCFLSSLLTRFIGSSIACATGTDFSWREKIILSLGFVGKASAQATLALMVYDHASEKLQTLNPGSPEYEKWSEWKDYGRTIANVSVVMILCAAPTSSLALRKLGAKWVRPDCVDEESEA